MDWNAMVGWLVLAGAMGFIIYLVYWCRRTIDRIAESGRRSLREIVKELRAGR